VLAGRVERVDPGRDADGGASSIPSVRARDAAVREVGDAVAPQTLCLLEAMKLLQRAQADDDRPRDCVHAENGKPVEFGAALFELEPTRVARPAL
jgi:biotin carboxyl carrier protein